MARRGLPRGIRRSVSRQATRVLETGRRFVRFDQLRQRHFWSSHMFIPDGNGYIASGTFQLFVTPEGSNGQGFPAGAVLTARETNWKSQNRVPDNQNFEITELGVSLGIITPSMGSVFDPAARDPSNEAVYDLVHNQFINNTTLSITYLTNSVPLGLVCDFGQASAAHVGTYKANGGVTTGSIFRSNGFPAPALRRRMKIPILLQHGETFSFQFDIAAGRSFFVGADIPQSAFVARMDFWATESFVEKS